MAILNFGFSKILVERLARPTKQINIKSGMNITDVSESKVVDGTKQQAFQIQFHFETSYEPKVATIQLDGELLYLADEALAKQINETWSKDKSLPKDVALSVFNRILHNCNVEALILSKELGLPAPIQMPKVRADTKPTPAPTNKATKNVPEK